MKLCIRNLFLSLVLIPTAFKIFGAGGGLVILEGSNYAKSISSGAIKLNNRFFTYADRLKFSATLEKLKQNHLSTFKIIALEYKTKNSLI